MIDTILENLPFSSIPELQAITTREQLMELLSIANFEKVQKGMDSDEILVEAIAAMKLAKETGSPAARSPKKPEAFQEKREDGPAKKEGPRCKFCDKEVSCACAAPSASRPFTATRSARARTGRSTRRPARPMPSNSHLALHVDAHIRPRVGGGLERVQLVLAGLGPEHAAHACPA